MSSKKGETVAALWATIPKEKICEALGAIADKRIEIGADAGSARVFSSSGKKFYTIKYDEKTSSIMCNDNSSYWTGYLGYPGVAFLMVKGKIHYSERAAKAFKGIPWKELNVKNRNDFKKT